MKATRGREKKEGRRKEGFIHKQAQQQDRRQPLIGYYFLIMYCDGHVMIAKPTLPLPSHTHSTLLSIISKTHRVKEKYTGAGG